MEGFGESFREWLSDWKKLSIWNWIKEANQSDSSMDVSICLGNGSGNGWGKYFGKVCLRACGKVWERFWQKVHGMTQ